MRTTKQRSQSTPSQFTSFAEHIAGYDKPPVGPVEVSRGFSLALDRAISARREFGKHGIEEVDEAARRAMDSLWTSLSGSVKSCAH